MIERRLSPLRVYIPLLFSLLALSSCGSVQEMYISAADEYVAQGEFAQAGDYITGRERQYITNKNEISFYLDRGLVAHYSGNYMQSNSGLKEAERLMEKAFTGDISDQVAAFARGDVKRAQYGGEDYENIYINMFKALNYYHMGNMESARVEVRRSNRKLRYITGEYAAQAESWKAALENFAGIPRELNFSNSALARYLSALIWRSGGYWDDARIDAQEAVNAFAEYPDVYNFPLPPFLVHGPDGRCAETNIPGGMARLNLLAFTGLSPLKVRPVDNYFWYREDLLLKENVNYAWREIMDITYNLYKEKPREKKVQVDIITLKPILTAFASYSMESSRVRSNEARNMAGFYALMLYDLYVNDAIEDALREILNTYRTAETWEGYGHAAEQALQLGDRLYPEGIRAAVPDRRGGFSPASFRPPSDELGEMRLHNRSSPVTRIEAVIDGQGTVPLYLLEDMGKVTELLYQRRKLRNEMAAAEYIIINVLQKGYDRVAGVPVANVLAGTGAVAATVFTAIPFALAELGTDAVKAVSAFGRNFALLFVDLFISTKGIYDARISRQVNKELGRQDDRMGRFFPDKAYAGGINLRPGVYHITINYYSGTRLIHSERRENVRAASGELNLVTSYSF